jgi:hypothetical protein
MTVIDILTRVDAICQKYDKYDVDKLNGANVAGEDPFARLYASVDAEISQCEEVPAPLLSLAPPTCFARGASRRRRSESDRLCCFSQKAEAARQEKSRAAVVAINAEIRRAKVKLVEEDMPKLLRLAVKKVRRRSLTPPR